MRKRPTVKTNPANVLRVIDGDTIEVAVDVGWNVAVTAVVRLAGVDCPERGTPEGSAATGFAADWVANNGSSITLISYSTKDRYGRHLADAISDEGRDLRDDLIAAGHGKAWNGRGKRP